MMKQVRKTASEKMPLLLFSLYFPIKFNLGYNFSSFSSHYLWFIDTVLRGGEDNGFDGRGEEEIRMHKHEHVAQPVNEEQENSTRRGHVQSFSTLDVIRPLVLYRAKFI